ncbi:4413_t:CDS:2 [Acaulospora colombiana]|uniref:4413_t:CDS:1 n=1 Tax=Acaulospora colombiana TaxID=27376 RepID=A0ACA9K4N9_9GLOM|nr:4413_t:CDS:2 [Acaulospora colombiana]
MSEWTPQPPLFAFSHPSSKETEEVKQISVKLTDGDPTKDYCDNNRAQDIDPTIMASNSPRNSIISTSRRNSVVAVTTNSRNSRHTGNEDCDNLWDDEFIGHIMNLVDSIGNETEQTSKACIKTDSGFAQIPEECKSQIPETPAQEYAQIVRNSIVSPTLESEPQLTEQVNSETTVLPSTETTGSSSVGQTLRRTMSNLSRRSSIHSRKSMDDSRSILSRTSRVSRVEKIAEVPEEESDTENNGRKIFSGKKKRASSDLAKSKSSNGFLRKFFKSKIDRIASLNKTPMSEEDAVDTDDRSVGGSADDIINSASSNNDINPDSSSMTEEEWQRVFKVCEEQGVSLLGKKRNHIHSNVNDGVREPRDDYFTSANNGASKVTGEGGGNKGHSNFYLAMPNGQWMVRTRTASRKIIGLLFDLHAGYRPDSDSPKPLPWPVTVHFKNFPAEKLIRANVIDAMQDFFMSMIKEADFLRNGSTKKVMNLSKNDQTQLWDGLWSRNELTLGDVLHQILPELFPSPQPSENAFAVPVIHGVIPRLDTPIVGASQNLCYPDNFLHIVVLLAI